MTTSIATWSREELERIGEAAELELASRRTDGSLRPFVTIWVGRVGDDIYVRSAYGPENGWYRRAKASGVGRIRAGGIERDVTFEEVRPDVHQGLDAAYHAKYHRYGVRVVGSVVGRAPAQTTLRLVPLQDARNQALLTEQ